MSTQYHTKPFFKASRIEEKVRWDQKWNDIYIYNQYIHIKTEKVKEKVYSNTLQEINTFPNYKPCKAFNQKVY